MKKIITHCYGLLVNNRKILLKMKLTFFLLTVLVLQVSAIGYSQTPKFNFEIKNEQLANVLKQIESNSDFRFFFQREQVDVNRKIDLLANNSTVEEVLNKLFENQGITYKVLENNLILLVSSDYFKANEQQQLIVTGKVTDVSTGEPLPGVNVQVKGTTLGAITDATGKYSISLTDKNVTLRFSFIGYVAQEVPLAGRSIVDVALVSEVKGLDEVVVIGYGTLKKSDLTGSLSQVKAEKITSFPTTNFLHALTGRSAGVQVIQNNGAPGSPVSIRIRGANSVLGSNEPLYVIDGFPTTTIDPQPISNSEMENYAITGSLPPERNNQMIIDNGDIESIEILKDASATAIYGSRGANGVVLITTKHGSTGKTLIDFEESYSIQSIRKKLDLMDAKEYATFYNEQALNDGQTQFFTQDQINGFSKGFDWQDLIFQKAPMNTLSLSVRGGNEKTQFSVSGNTLNQTGIIKGSNFNRYAFRVNLNHSISSKLSFNLSSGLGRTINDKKSSQGGSRGNSMISAAISAPPTLTPYKDDGTYTVLSAAYPFLATDLINPLNFINEQSDRNSSNSILTNASFIYNPIPDLTIKILGGVEDVNARNDGYTTIKFINSDGSADVKNSEFLSLLSENTITYNKVFNQIHNISVLAGFTYQDFLNTYQEGTGGGFLNDNSQTYDLGAASRPGVPTSGYSKSTLLSYLGRINYSLKEKYLATVSFRADGSSKYSKGNKWGYFPSAAIAWRISNEEFLKDVPTISNLKIRASWGMTGSQAVDAYATLNQLYSGKTIFNDALFTTFAPGSRLPGNLKWETTAQTNLGLDLGLLENRLSFTIDYYIKKTRDLLNIVKLPSSMGYTSTIKNVGSVQNKGLELDINAVIFSGEFSWTVNTNVSINRNKVLKLYDGEDILGAGVDVVSMGDYLNILREGQPIGRFWGYLEDGYDENGHIKFKDLNNDGSITAADKTYIGNPNPSFIYGLNSTMSYKNFEFSFFILGSQGNDIYNVSSINNTIDYGFGLNMPKEVFRNHWTPTNTTAKYPIISRSSTAKNSNRWVEDGSYLRVKNIQIAYNLTPQLLKSNWIRNIQLYVSGQNLITLTNYSWFDPEVNSVGGANSTALGIDHYTYPIAKSITFGIRAGF